MPLLIIVTAGWIAGLFVGAIWAVQVAAVSRSGAGLWLGALVLVALFGWRWIPHGVSWRGSAHTVLCTLAVAIAGALCTEAAQREGARCRARAVAVLAQGAALSLAYDGPMPVRESAREFASASAQRVERGRGELHLIEGGALAVDCRIAATVRLPRGVAAGSIVTVRGSALATTRGLRLTVDTVLAAPQVDRLRTWRARTGATIDRLFGADAALVRALVIADQDGITPAVRDRFADAGLVHMLSVSGMHVAIIASALLTLTAAMRLSPTVGALLTLLLIGVYVAMLGAPAPAVRSAVMLITVMGSRWSQRPLHEWTALALGAALPTVEPLVVVDLGWQLSVSGMAALVAARAILRRLTAPPMYAPMVTERSPSALGRVLTRAQRRGLMLMRAQRGVARWLMREMVTGVVATLVTAPLIAWTFGRVSVLAPLTNIVAGPIVAFLQPALFLALLLSWCEPLAQLVADATSLPIRLLDGIAAGGAAVPFATLQIAPTRAAALCAGIASLAVVRATATRRAAGWIRVAALSLTLAVWLPVISGGSGRLEVHMLDVGQGDAFALRTPRGRWILIDAGPSWDGGDAGRRIVVPYVQRRGGPVALMIMSHAHEDHVGGAASVIAALAPRHWWEPAFVTTSSGYRQALDALRRNGEAWRRVRPGQRWQLDGVTLEVLAPDSAWTAAQVDANETSVVLRVAYGQRRFLFTGDAEGQEEAWLLRQFPVGALQADVLKLGHHGSKTSSGEAFVNAVSPLVGLVSVGAGNRYRHPSPEVLARFAAKQIPLLRTDRDGGVVLRTDGHLLEAEANGDRWIIPPRDAPRK